MTEQTPESSAPKADWGPPSSEKVPESSTPPWTTGFVSVAPGSPLPPAPTTPAGAGVPGEPKNPRRKRRLLIAVVVAVVLAVTVGAFLLIRADQQRKQEERDAILSDFEVSESLFDSALTALDETLVLADVTALTGADTLNDATLLDDLATVQADAQDVADRAGALSIPGVDGTSNDDLIALDEEMSDLTAEMDTARTALSDGIDSVNDDAAAKRAADEAEAARVAEETRLAEEAAAREEKKSQAATISYEELFRGGQSLVGNFYRLEGEVIQAAGTDDGLAVYRVNITRDPGYSRDFWKDTILIGVAGDPSQRILENDIISFVGISAGVTSYESIFGATIEVPLLAVDGQDVQFSGRSE